MPAALSIPPSMLLGGKIRLVQRIGRGGMGDVWMARNEATQAEVAVKTLVKAERNASNDERFRREARLAATVTHRNVVRIFDLIDDADGTLGLVMELLRGGTLEACIRERGPLSAIHACAVAVPILSALHHVHEKGIIHRDVKPANIFFAVEPDEHVIPKILDFGIAKLPAAGSALTMDGSVLGTPHYMSPEQIRGAEDLDGRSDMFSLAVVLYEMLTGVRVFQRDTAAASLAAVLEHDVDPDPRIEPRLWVALSRALAKRPYERYASCADCADALRTAVGASDADLAQSLQDLRPRSEAIADGGLSPVALENRGSIRPPRARGARRSLGFTAGAAVGAALFATGLTLALTHSRASPRAEEPPATATTTSVASASAPMGGAGGAASGGTGAAGAGAGASDTSPTSAASAQSAAPPPRGDGPSTRGGNGPAGTAATTGAQPPPRVPATRSPDIGRPSSVRPTAPTPAVAAPAPRTTKPAPKGDPATRPGF